MNMHLCAAVNFKIRELRTDPVKQTEILNQKCVCVILVQKLRLFHRIIDLILKQKRIHGHIHFYTPDMTVTDRFFEFIMIKIPRKCPRTEIADTEIYRITPALHRSDQSFRIPDRREQFNFFQGLL